MNENEKILSILMTALNSLYELGQPADKVMVRMLQLIDEFCDTTGLDMPDDAVCVNVELDERFGYNVLWKKIVL